MSNLEFFKKQSKNFLKDWKSQTKIVVTDGNVYFRYSPKFFDIKDWFSYFELSAKDEQDVKLSRAQHYIAKIAGFKKWTDLIAASEKELIYAEIKLRNFKNSMDLIQWDYIEKDYELADLDIDSKIEYAKQFFKGVNVTGFEGEEKAITPKIITGKEREAILRVGNYSFGRKMTSIVKCLYCDDEYKYEDSKVIQFPNEDEPYIVCKNYPKCDGSLIDMFSPDDEEDDDYGGGVPFDWDMDQGYVDEYE